MESNYRNSGFEEYVKQQADQHRMFPSEKVWKNIHGALHTRRKWYGIGLAFLLVLTGTAVTLVMISYPVSPKQQGRLATANTPEKEKASSPSKATINKTILPFNGQVIEQAKPLFSETANNRSAILQENREDISIAALPEPIHALGANERERVALVVPSRNNVSLAVKTGTTEEYNRIPDNQVEEQPAVTTAMKTTVPENRSEYPLTIESVTNAYQPKKAGKKASWQFFITPTVSYRKLKVTGTTDNLASSFPVGNLSNVNSAVTHKPDLGLQIGTSYHYPITKSLRIRGGFQFNINRYDIKAFTYNPEVATIRLNDANGAVWAWTSYRNYSGYKSNWLKNYYFSVAAPIGVEMKLLGNKKTSFGIASTIQPTFILKDKAYLISTDFKNYAKVPSLVRKLNANAGFEAFINYSNGKTRWQIGPQARYQLLSSFRKEYPVKEHLFDFGLKMGVFINE